MASIVLNFDWGTDEAKEKKISDWFQNADVHFSHSARGRDTLHVARDPKYLKLNEKFELEENTEAHKARGRLYGFPSQAAKVYAQEIVNFKPFPNPHLIHPPMVKSLRKKYWYPYIEYLLRRGHEYEDSLVAKSWADIARREIPTLASEYEKDVHQGLKKLEKDLAKFYENN
jgi:hypothetical protein